MNHPQNVIIGVKKYTVHYCWGRHSTLIAICREEDSWMSWGFVSISRAVTHTVLWSPDTLFLLAECFHLVVCPCVSSVGYNKRKNSKRGKDKRGANSVKAAFLIACRKTLNSPFWLNWEETQNQRYCMHNTSHLHLPLTKWENNYGWPSLLIPKKTPKNYTVHANTKNTHVKLIFYAQATEGRHL